MPIGTGNTTVPGCGLHHISVQARDWEASLRFYRDVLGMKPVVEFEVRGRTMALLDVGDGSHIELCAPLPDTPAPGSPAANDPILHIALATTDTRAALEHVRRAGYAVTVEPRDVDLSGLLVTVAFCKGPNGELIEFFQTR
jgi:catechol 2,3-dioxygenase-like lactoylglutathione lyase family enzyme